MTLLIFDEDQLLGVEVLNKESNLRMYLPAARSGALAYELQRVVHRNTPYLTLSSHRDEETRAKLRAKRDCELDEYSVGHREFHGTEATSGGDHELQVGVELLDTDSASTERIHSEVLRRNAFRKMCRAVSFPEVGAWRCARMLSGFGGRVAKPSDFKLGVSAKDKKRGRDKRKRCDKKISATKKTRTKQQMPGAWRAFVHLNAEGRKLDRQVSSELSAQYSQLTADERTYYNEIGCVATNFKRKRIQPAVAAPKRVIQHRVQLLDGVVADVAVPVHDENAIAVAGEIGGRGIVDTVAVVQATHPAVVEAAFRLSDARRGVAMQAEDARADAAVYRAWEQERVPNEFEDDARRRMQGVRDGRPRPVAAGASALDVCVSADTLAVSVPDNMQHCTDAYAAAWDKMHARIFTSQCKKLGNIPIHRRWCLIPSLQCVVVQGKVAYVIQRCRGGI